MRVPDRNTVKTAVVTVKPLCYNCCNILRRVGTAVKVTSDAVWEWFRHTGSVGAYLLYRQLLQDRLQKD